MCQTYRLTKGLFSRALGCKIQKEIASAEGASDEKFRLSRLNFPKNPPKFSPKLEGLLQMADPPPPLLFFVTPWVTQCLLQTADPPPHHCSRNIFCAPSIIERRRLPRSTVWIEISDLILIRTYCLRSLHRTCLKQKPLSRRLQTKA